ncbi:hypothetical protein GCM10027292_02100 [Hydrogenophaga aquatica]
MAVRSAARPPAPLGSLALKLITQGSEAGAASPAAGAPGGGMSKEGVIRGMGRGGPDTMNPF